MHAPGHANVNESTTATGAKTVLFRDEIQLQICFSKRTLPCLVILVRDLPPRIARTHEELGRAMSSCIAFALLSCSSRVATGVIELTVYIVPSSESQPLLKLIRTTLNQDTAIPFPVSFSN